MGGVGVGGGWVVRDVYLKITCDKNRELIN